MMRGRHGLAVLVVLMGANACMGGGGARPAGVCRSGSQDAQQQMICRGAVRYGQAKLGMGGMHVLRLRIGGGSGDCAMAEMATPVGDRRVLFAASGHVGEDLWQPFALSTAFQWSDYVPDSDVNCGLYNAGLLSNRDLPKTGFATS
jgi:hypothetical protein